MNPATKIHGIDKGTLPSQFSYSAKDTFVCMQCAYPLRKLKTTNEVRIELRHPSLPSDCPNASEYFYILLPQKWEELGR